MSETFNAALRGRLLKLAIAAVAALVLAGCQPEDKPEAPKELRLAVTDEGTYQHFFRTLFEGRFPDWDITVLPMDGLKLHELETEPALQALDGFLQREKPDLLLVNSLMYRPVADAGMLRDLGEWTSRDGMDMNVFVPGMLELMKDNEEGKLFGLSPGIRTSVLYYNKTMFRSYGIEEPSDPMTWSALLSLSDRFTQDASLEEGSYGFYEPYVRSPFDLVQVAAQTEGLHFVDTRHARMTMQSEEWKRLWRMVADSYRRGSLGVNSRELKVVDGVTYVSREDQEASDLFYKGKVAMTYGQVDLMQKLKAKPPSFEWGVLPGPVSERDPERTWWFVSDYIFAIPTAAGRPESAWNAVRELHSEEVGKIYASAGSELSSLKDYPKWKNDPDYEPFYLQKGWPNQPNYRMSIIPTEFYGPFNELVVERMNATIANEITTEQALDSLQQEGQQLLDKFVPASE
ncbi:extracellular solute-binding protein [Cohnella hongkongensis]|uniref:Extracellular solute-binding protein n=1 Tax=Cohnella hongkongensis TaxID=178337 RepID=A0ABV9F9V4_9BACL